MNLINLILNLASSISKKIGQDLYKEKKVKRIESKKIDDIYHLYGIVIDNNIEQRTHIKYNLKKKKLDSVSCTCNNYKENSQQIKNYICCHIAATTYKYYSLLKKKYNEKLDTKTIQSVSSVSSAKPNLVIILKEEKINKNIKYHLELKVGKERAVTVDSLVNFLYTLNKFDFPKEDYKILEYLIRKLKENKNRIINGRTYVIELEELYDFLNLIDENKNLSLTYDYMNYNSKIIKEDMPLVHTLKERDNKIILTGQKKKVVPLNKERTVWLYDKKIYLPSKEQIKYYNIIFDKLEAKGRLVYTNTKENLKKLIYILKKISKNINYDEAIIGYIKEINKPIFILEKLNENIFCILEMTKINKDVDYKEKEKIEIILEGLRFTREGEKYRFVGNDEEQYKFLKYGIDKLKNMGLVKISSAFEKNYLINNKNIYSEIIKSNEDYIFSYKIDDISYDEIGDIINSINRGESFYKTRKNSILELEDTKVSEFFHNLSELNMFKTVYKDSIYVDKFQLLHLEQKINEGKLPEIKGKELINEITDKLKNKKEEYEVPKKLKAKLRDYQVRGYNWLKQIENLSLGGILADDMGLGKTIQTIALLLSSKNKKSLVICPTAVIYNWKNEFSKFAPSLKIGIIHGNKKERDKVKEDYKKYDCLLTTYGTLKNDFDFYIDKIFDFIIIDEAQNIKNKDSKTTEIVKKLKGECKFALSGTPIENNLLELWSIFDFIMPGYLYSEEKFKLKFLRGKDESLNDLKAGGVGLNLTSASLVVHFDPWWNPAVEDQATDRVHRLGQKNIVEVIKLISKDTIEEKIVALQNEKRELINSIIEENNLKGEVLNKITREELLELFN